MELRLPNFVLRLLQTRAALVAAYGCFLLFLPLFAVYAVVDDFFARRKKRRLARTLSCPTCAAALDSTSVTRADVRWNESMRDLMKKDPFSARYRVIRYLDAICGSCGAEIVFEEEPNKAPEPTPPSVTPRAVARVAPAGGVAHL